MRRTRERDLARALRGGTADLVGIWGDENRRPAAVKFFIYTFFGSTVMLAGFLLKNPFLVKNSVEPTKLPAN